MLGMCGTIFKQIGSVEEIEKNLECKKVFKFAYRLSEIASILYISKINITKIRMVNMLECQYCRIWKKN